MSAIVPCVPTCCSTATTTNVPGNAGGSAVTTTTASFVIPASGATVTIAVTDTTWLSVGKNVFISDGSKKNAYLVTGIGGATSLTVENLALPADSAAGGTVASGAIVSPGLGDYLIPQDLDLLTAFTDSTGGTKSDTIAASLAKQTLIIPVQFTDYVNATTLKLAVPFAFLVNSVLLRVSKAGTGAGASITLQSQINGVAMTGGSVVSTLANSATVGGTVAGTAITGLNTGTAGQTIELGVTVGTVFTAGDGWFEFNVTNTDLTSTLAAIAFKANQLRTALRHQ